MDAKLLVYFVPFVLLIVWNLSNKKRVHSENSAALAENKQSGLTEPASLHPIIDTVKCLGCASCVSACPEGKILGLIDGRAQLIHPTHCIGHGACKERRRHQREPRRDAARVSSRPVLHPHSSIPHVKKLALLQASHFPR